MSNGVDRRTVPLGSGESICAPNQCVAFVKKTALIHGRTHTQGDNEPVVP